MGAEFNYRLYADDYGKHKIAKAWREAVEESLYEDGHSYSGCIGMLGPEIDAWNDAAFASLDEASVWLEKNQQKWAGATAVSFMKGDSKVWMIGGWCSS